MTVPSLPRALLVHDGELDDVRALFEELGTPFLERRGASRAEDELAGWQLVVATASRMLELGVAVGLPIRIAFLEKDADTAREALRAARVDFLVRRPVQRDALRLLLLRALYGGPERRAEPRVSVGAEVAFRTFLRRRSAILTELSSSGCRLLTQHPLQRSERLTLCLPAELAGGRRLTLRGRVLRCERPGGEIPGSNSFAVRFEAVAAAEQARLRLAVETYANGPAVLPGRDGPGSEIPAVDEVEARDLVDPADTPGAQASAGAPGDAGLDDPERPDRRTAPRHLMARHVIALGEQAARVLLGRDISTHGMRVDAHPELALGDTLQLALHARAGDLPLVVGACVERDDGRRGLWLRFRDLSPEQTARLEELLGVLPVLASIGEHGEEELLVWEIVRG